MIYAVNQFHENSESLHYLSVRTASKTAIELDNERLLEYINSALLATAFSRAEVAELVDALGSGSSGDHTPWEFESPLRHHGNSGELGESVQLFFFGRGG